MAKDQTKRLSPGQLQADQNALTAAGSFDNYQPANPAYGLEQINAALSAMQSAQQAEVNAQNALAAARDTANAAEWTFHNIVLGLKDQVIAQYGADSNELQALGLKKKSERKSPKRKPAAT